MVIREFLLGKYRTRTLQGKQRIPSEKTEIYQEERLCEGKGEAPGKE